MRRSTYTYNIFILAIAVLLARGMGKAPDAEAYSGKRTVVPSQGLQGDDSVWVVKPDGTKSCTPGTPESLEPGGDALRRANIHVLDSGKGMDGLLHAQMCGIPSGSLNGYRIPRSELPQAVALGFKEAPESFSRKP